MGIVGDIKDDRATRNPEISLVGAVRMGMGIGTQPSHPIASDDLDAERGINDLVSHPLLDEKCSVGLHGITISV
jgi:hypothetical protein